MSCEQVLSNEVLDVRDGTHDSPKYKDYGYPLITSKNLKEGIIDFSDVNLISEDDYIAINKRSKVEQGDILYSMIGSIGNYALVDQNPTYAIKNVALFKFTDNRLYNRYFLHLLNSFVIIRQIERAMKGGTQKFVSLKILRNLKIPLPPLDQQKKIVAILDTADAYRQKTKALIDKYDELTQSLFLDMFGDPVTNPKGWDKKIAFEYYEVRGRVGWKGYKKTDLRQDGAIVLGATHVTQSGDIDLEKVVYLSDEKYIESPEIMVKLYDLIFVQRGNTIGKVALVREELGETTINPVVLIFRPKKANPFFLLYLLMNKELNREFVNSNSGSAQPMITQKTMKEFLLIDVPLNEQDKFGLRVQAIEAQKAQAQASLAQADNLFNSLLQKAFKGELV